MAGSLALQKLDVGMILFKDGDWHERAETSVAWYLIENDSGGIRTQHRQGQTDKWELLYNWVAT